jgi:hypothetical protein
MRISRALHIAVMASALGIAGEAVALDLKNLNAETPPDEALRYGVSSYKSGDKGSAVEALSFAADKGSTGAQWKLGRMYAAGDGVERDEYKAFELFSEVAESPASDEDEWRQPVAPYVSDALVQLGTFFRRGIPNTEVTADPGRARDYFRRAALYFGDADAQLNLALMFYNGEGGPRDLGQAAKWSRHAALKGNADATALLVTVSLDIARAYLSGEGVPRSGREAAKWARQAVEHDSADGQALLGHILFEGDGVARRPVDGLMYLTIALERTEVDATWIRDLHERARSAATAEEWNAAKLRADEWLAQHPADVAINATQ